MTVLKVCALILALAAGLATWSHAAAQEEVIAIGSATIAVGGSGSVMLVAGNIGEPGLAAWSLDVFYDPEVVEVADCAPENGSICNPNYASNTIRVTGANATGLEGNTNLASITFTCLAQATGPLTIASLDFADGTLGDPQPIDAAIANGSIHCQALVQPTQTIDSSATATPTPSAPAIVDAGTGPGDLRIDNWSLVIAGLIGAGIAWLIVGVGGAGLTAATATALPWRRSPEPGDSIVGSDLPAPAAHTEPHDSSMPTWLVAAQKRLSGANANAIPAFRRSQRRE